ncbi:hypothetical protein ACFQ4C_03470 [Larkinella insperata]|uniref:Uncharacterized protein n=1 Tax=Larkinella insperata TaxID=332158 RepID=A0ABW3Q050_9BACT|nr:hypothetical protein [Larkinella insperata]
MNDTLYVNELLRQLKTTNDPAVFDALFVMYIYRYRQVLDNTVHFTITEKIPFSLITNTNYN